jgi:cytochrome c5
MYKFLLHAVILITFSASLQARQNYSEQGIKTYLKLCKQCHGNPYKGAAMLKKKEWKRLFAEGDEKIYAVHAKNKKAIKVLNTSYYKNRRRHLVKFLISSGSDSGVVPACDGNFCGD